MGFSFKYTRYSAIAQTTLGILLVLFGIADRATMSTYRYAFHTISVAPIWMGIWIVITGVIGLLGTRRNHANQNNSPSGAMVGTYLGFSITSVVFAGVIIILYVLGVVVIHGGGCYYTHYVYDGRNYYKRGGYKSGCSTSVALGSMVVIFAILEFGFGIMACVCSCMNGCCNSSAPQMQGQVVYIQNAQEQTPYIMTQGANGVPVAVPAQGAILVQSQAQAVPANQVVYPSSYNAGAVGGGGGDGYSQAPPLQEKHSDMPPSYQP